MLSLHFKMVKMIRNWPQRDIDLWIKKFKMTVLKMLHELFCLGLWRRHFHCPLWFCLLPHSDLPCLLLQPSKCGPVWGPDWPGVVFSEIPNYFHSLITFTYWSPSRNNTYCYFPIAPLSELRAKSWAEHCGRKEEWAETQEERAWSRENMGTRSEPTKWAQRWHGGRGRPAALGPGPSLSTAGLS